MTSNRPGIGNSEALVGRAVVQVELGVQTGVEESGDARDWSTGWGQSTLRVGVVDPVEVFVSWGGLSVDRVAESGATRIEAGATDLILGAKFALLDESRQLLTLTVEPSTSVPIGGDDFSSGSYDGALRLAWARSLPKDWGLSGNVLFLSTTDANGRYWDNLVTTAISRPLSSSISAFAELATGLAAPRAWTVDGGISWVPRPNVQWDVSSGVSVRGPGRSWFVSAGVTLRRLPRYMRSATDTRKAAFTGPPLDSAGTALTGATNPRLGKTPICDRRRASSSCRRKPPGMM
jgi:hypothetical protein